MRPIAASDPDIKTELGRLSGRPFFVPEGWAGCLVQQAGGRDTEHGRKLLQDADAGVASGTLKVAQIDLGHAGLEGNILLRPLLFGAKHPQISSEPVADIHAPIAPRKQSRCDH